MYLWYLELGPFYLDTLTAETPSRNPTIDTHYRNPTIDTHCRYSHYRNSL